MAKPEIQFRSDFDVDLRDEQLAKFFKGPLLERPYVLYVMFDKYKALFLLEDKVVYVDTIAFKSANECKTFSYYDVKGLLAKSISVYLELEEGKPLEIACYNDLDKATIQEAKEIIDEVKKNLPERRIARFDLDKGKIINDKDRMVLTVNGVEIPYDKINKIELVSNSGKMEMRAEMDKGTGQIDFVKGGLEFDNEVPKLVFYAYININTATGPRKIDIIPKKMKVADKKYPQAVGFAHQLVEFLSSIYDNEEAPAPSRREEPRQEDDSRGDDRDEFKKAFKADKFNNSL